MSELDRRDLLTGAGAVAAAGLVFGVGGAAAIGGGGDAPKEDMRWTLFSVQPT